MRVVLLVARRMTNSSRVVNLPLTSNLALGAVGRGPAQIDGRPRSGVHADASAFLRC